MQRIKEKFVKKDSKWCVTIPQEFLNILRINARKDTIEFIVRDDELLVYKKPDAM